MTLHHTVHPDGTEPLPKFLATLDPKLRQKLLTQLHLLTRNPNLGEPHVKHFTISKYARFYELRTRSKQMVRIIFTLLPDGSALLLEPFIKRHQRNTMQALEASLATLRQIEAGEICVRELGLHRLWEEVR